MSYEASKTAEPRQRARAANRLALREALREGSDSTRTRRQRVVVLKRPRSRSGASRFVASRNPAMRLAKRLAPAYAPAYNLTMKQSVGDRVRKESRLSHRPHFLAVAAALVTLSGIGFLAMAILAPQHLTGGGWLLAGLSLPVTVVIIALTAIVRERLIDLCFWAHRDSDSIRMGRQATVADIVRIFGEPGEQWDDGVECSLAYSLSDGTLRFSCESQESGAGHLRQIEFDSEAPHVTDLDPPTPRQVPARS